MKYIYVTILSLFFTLNLAAQDWNQIRKALATDAYTNGKFGYSVSISGDYAIVGTNEPAISAGVYIFHKTGSQTWDNGIKIVAYDAEVGDYFGTSVSISGDYAIVGAYGEDSGGSNAGAAYIYQRIGVNTWDSGTKIVASDPEANDYFGRSVSISGDYAIVGANGEDAAAVSAGAAYIYQRTAANTWSIGKKIFASNAGAQDMFGTSVSISGDYAIVGAYGEDSGDSEAGAAYIYRRITDNIWSSGSKILAYDAQVSDYFAYSVSISGDYALVGAYGEDSGGSDAGAAYIYHRVDTNSWDSGRKIVAPDANASEYFGYSVSISGDYSVVGAYFNSDAGTLAGAAYIYKRTGLNNWDSGIKKTASDAAVADYFGYSVSISGDYAIVGAYGEDDGGDGAGAAYLYKAAIVELSMAESIKISDTEYSYNVSVVDGENNGLTQHGLVWSTSENPTLELNEDSTALGTHAAGNFTFSSNATVSVGPGYYVRAYATTASGTYYSDQVHFGVVPTLPEWGLIILAGGFVLAGGWFVFRKMM